VSEAHPIKPHTPRQLLFIYLESISNIENDKSLAGYIKKKWTDSVMTKKLTEKWVVKKLFHATSDHPLRK